MMAAASYSLPSTAKLAMRVAALRAGVPLPIESSTKSVKQKKPPMEWPAGSLYARQIAILKWIASNGGSVDYGE